MNRLYFGDNLDILKQLYKEHPEGFIDLIYIDPPFNSNRNYNILFESIDMTDTKAQKEAFKDTWSNVTYQDTLEEIHDLDLDLYSFITALDNIRISKSIISYLTTMAIRIWYMKKVLKNTGSFYLHCDPTMSHYLKIICDLIFSTEILFRNEIIWSNESSSGFKTQVKKKYVRGHDTLLFYSSKHAYFNIPRQPLADSTIKRYDKIDNKGEKYKIYYDSDGTERKQYLTKSQGRKYTDVWTDIPSFQTVNANREWIGYDTQKPEKLLERILLASSKENNIIADFFCGCGTTVAAAQKLNRSWLGVDISHLAIKLISKRLMDTYGKEIRNTYEIFGFPKDLASAHELANGTKKGRLKFEEWIIEIVLHGILNPNRAEPGYDGYLTFNIGKIKDTVLIETKSGNTNLSQLNHFIKTVENKKAAIGIFVCFSEHITKGMKIAANKSGYYQPKAFKIENKYFKIQLITVDDLLNNIMPIIPYDLSTFKTAKAKDTGEQLEVDIQ
ncbi:MAG: site-specific DNA-methyltransferase [Bacteroidales bacterium]|nr:site-specific DNA-methyltransferase [Bacteroidales bacterium]